MITLPLTPSTHSLISTPEFALMRPDAILINVARGGIVDEDALVDALRENRIAGAAADVFSREPAGRENVLVREGGMGGRLVLSPHVAWFARSSIEKLRRTVVENIEAWVGGEVRNVVV
jgi:glycerate dehydrogenase